MQKYANWKPKAFRDVTEAIMSSTCVVTKLQPSILDFGVDTYHDISIKNSRW